LTESVDLQVLLFKFCGTQLYCFNPGEQTFYEENLLSKEMS